MKRKWKILKHINLNLGERKKREDEKVSNPVNLSSI